MIIYTMIDDLRRKLQGSLITKSKQHRLKMLLTDVVQNRHRVQSILTRLNDAQDIAQYIAQDIAQYALEKPIRYNCKFMI